MPQVHEKVIRSDFPKWSSISSSWLLLGVLRVCRPRHTQAISHAVRNVFPRFAVRFMQPTSTTCMHTSLLRFYLCMIIIQTWVTAYAKHQQGVQVLECIRSVVHSVASPPRGLTCATLSRTVLAQLDRPARTARWVPASRSSPPPTANKSLRKRNTTMKQNWRFVAASQTVWEYLFVFVTLPLFRVCAQAFNSKRSLFGLVRGEIVWRNVLAFIYLHYATLQAFYVIGTGQAKLSTCVLCECDRWNCS